MRAAAQAVAEALFVTERGGGDRVGWLLVELEDFLSRCGTKSRLVFRACLLAVSLLGPLVAGRLSRLRTIERPRRARALARLERSPLAMPLLAVKAILCLLYYEHPDVVRELGLDVRGPKDAAGALTGSPRRDSR